MKLLIADDEKLVRSSLISMLEELEFPLQIVGEASNGEELVELVKKYSPDIAFVDIKMPKCNGLEAIKIAKTYSPQTKWIILTGFSEFDYAKEAIKLGANNYLLKPVSPEELQNVLTELIQQNMQACKILNKEFENELIALCNDLISLHESDKPNIISNSHFMCSIFLFDSYLDESEKSKKQKEFYRSIKNEIGVMLSNELRIALFVLPSGELTTIGVWGFMQSENDKAYIQKYFDKVINIARQQSCDSFSIKVLLSNECKDFETLHKRINQLQNLSPLRVIIENEISLGINKLAQKYEECPPVMLEMCNSIVKLSLSYKEKVYLNYMKVLGDIEKVISGSKLFENTSFKKPVSEFLQNSIGCKNGVDKDFKNWIKNMTELGERILTEGQKADNSTSDIVKQVIAFIEESYMEDIGIGQIAEQLSITPNYLSFLFHKKIGMTFLKYMTKVRMLKAKELLSYNSFQVQQVAEKVGYFSSRHFTKLFKEYYGVYPSEYRDSSIVSK